MTTTRKSRTPKICRCHERNCWLGHEVSCHRLGMPHGGTMIVVKVVKNWSAEATKRWGAWECSGPQVVLCRHADGTEVPLQTSDIMKVY